MLVFVINKQDKKLMPCKSSKARKLLKQKKAKIVDIKDVIEIKQITFEVTNSDIETTYYIDNMYLE